MKVFFNYIVALSVVIVFILGYLPLNASPRHYISSDCYEKYADYVVDPEVPLTFDPSNIPARKSIYTGVRSVGYFFEKIFPLIRVPFVLITTRRDDDRSAPGLYLHYLDDSRIIAWFGQNCDCCHPKFRHIPIGLANETLVYGSKKRILPHGDKKMFDTVLDELGRNAPCKKDLLYINFHTKTNLEYRQKVYNFFKDKNFIFAARQQPPREYLCEMATYRFVLSPWGNGLDCHRTWEALLVGSIPVTESSTLDPLFEDLPVIIVKSWDEVTLNFLKKKAKEFAHKNFNYDKLFLDYWLAQIEMAKQ